MKVDLFAERKTLYSPPSKQPVLVEVPPTSYLMVDGTGGPEGSAEFQQAMEALFGVAYTLKFSLKKGPLGLDFKVMPPEGLWWSGDRETLDPTRKDGWNWTMMIAVPDFVTPEMVAGAIVQLREKKNPVGLGKLRLERLDEGMCAQIMHIGPYAEETATIERLHAFIREQGREPRGKHHEIYLSDPRRAKPEKLKTVVRQPVQ